ncbi:hypothetical protein L1049_028313 [Liquidambar formosana]|uniref:Uncharacterized protein n=1 Tax=Liquidambar formosana TaxID=63359 RepID=A0AAP0WTA2_LIQFO
MFALGSTDTPKIAVNGWSDPQRRPLINFIAVNEVGPMFLKAINCQGEYKDKNFIASLITDTVGEVGPQNVIQVITNNAPVCRSAGLLVEAQYPQIFWTPCVVHTLNLALKNICAAKDTEANAITFAECNWITDIALDANIIKVFITTHSMRLAIYNQFVRLKMLAIADTRFASVVIMLKRFKMLKRGLQSMVISDQWVSYKEDNVKRAQFVKDKVLDDLWWDQINYIISFLDPIYDMLRIADTDKPCLHLVYDMWDNMIEKVRVAIYRHEHKHETKESSFFDVVHKILVDRWSKNNTPLHCMAHSLNPSCVDEFSDQDSMNDRGIMDPKLWWVVHGASTPKLQALAIKLLGQPSSSSCSERNWSTYSFINSVKRNKMTPQRAEDLVFVHSNLRLLSRRTQQYKEGESKMWDVGGDAFDPLDGAGILEFANLTLDEPELEIEILGEGGHDVEVDE